MSARARAARREPEDDSVRLAATAARIAWAKRGSDVVVLDIGDVLPVASCFVMATANNRRHARTLGELIKKAFKKLGRARLGAEGLDDGRWVVLDYGDVVVHVLQAQDREFYDLDDLWHGAPKLDWEAVESLPVDPELLAPARGASQDDEDEDELGEDELVDFDDDDEEDDDEYED